MNAKRLVGLITALLLAAVASPAAAQYYSFGKNKVQYESFQWHKLEGAHVEIATATDASAKAGARPLYQAPTLQLSLPQVRVRDGRDGACRHRRH